MDTNLAVLCSISNIKRMKYLHNQSHMELTFVRVITNSRMGVITMICLNCRLDLLIEN